MPDVALEAALSAPLTKGVETAGSDAELCRARTGALPLLLSGMNSLESQSLGACTSMQM